MTTRSKILLGVAVLVFLIGLFSGVKLHSIYISRNTIESVPDTVYVPQVVDIPEPVLVGKERDTSTLSVPKEDVKISADSISMELPKEIVTYRDSLPSGISYTATVTGYQPVLSGLKLSYPEKTVKTTVYKPYEGWALSAFGQAAYSTPATFLAGGLSLSYNIKAFNFHIDAGVSHFRFPAAAPVTSPYIGVGTNITILRFKR